MTNGGETAAEPGQRPAYGHGTTAARLRDPDGYRVEIAVGTE